jgi:glycine C-acetyltransferase
MIESNGMAANSLSWVAGEISSLKNLGLYSHSRVLESAIGPVIKIEGRKVINLCSNNYLGFADHPQLKKAAIAAINKFGIGPAAVRSIAGTTLLHQKLEEKLAKFKKVESVLTFQSGFFANLAVIPAIVGENDIIYSDELNHASIIDACRLSKAQVIRYNHLDINDLETKIKLHSPSAKKSLIVTDGVFSMDGDIAPLTEIYQVAKKYGCILMVDDAHGEGVLGKGGRGIVDHFKLHGKVDIEVGTMSKAFGVVGGMVAGRTTIIDWLKQRARPYLFSSAMTIPDVAACIKAVEILQRSDKQVEKLWKNASYLRDKLNQLGFDTGNSQTPIIPVMLGDAKLARNFSRKLFDHGVFAMAIGYPTVAMNKARIRVMSSAAHSKKELDSALDSFRKVGLELNVI